MQKEDLAIGKYFSIGVIPNLRIGVAIVFEAKVNPKLVPDSLIDPEELFEHQNPDGKQKYYMPKIEGTFNFYAPFTNASYAEIAFRIDNRGPIITFGRKTEDQPFKIGKKGHGMIYTYIALRLYHPNKLPKPGWHFEPVFVRVSTGSHSYFIKLYAYWNSETVEIRISSNPKSLPGFFRH